MKKSAAKTSQLKEYCKYLISRYRSLNNKYREASLYLEMEQFVEEGRVGGLFEKNAKNKIAYLHLFRKDIIFFAKHSLGKRIHIKKIK